MLLKNHTQNRKAAERLGYRIRVCVAGEPCVLPVGTLDQLVEHYMAPRITRYCGALPPPNSPCLVTGAKRCRHDKWVVDMTVVGAIRACAVPDCTQPPAGLHAKYCKEHAGKAGADGRCNKRRRTETGFGAGEPAGTEPWLEPGAAWLQQLEDDLLMELLVERLGRAAAMECFGYIYLRRPAQPSPVAAHYTGGALLAGGCGHKGRHEGHQQHTTA
jgi:hypothetical protein